MSDTHATHAFWLAGRQATGEGTFEVTSPWDGRLVGTVSVPTEAQVEEAVAAAYAVQEEFAATPAHVRAAALDHVARRLVERTRGDRPADLRRERQADEVGAR